MRELCSSGDGSHVNESQSEQITVVPRICEALRSVRRSGARVTVIPRTWDALRSDLMCAACVVGSRSFVVGGGSASGAPGYW